MSGRGSTANVIAALASFCIPGVGQFLQGRVIKGLILLILSGIFWAFFLMGWIIHIWAAVDAARYEPPGNYR